MNATQGNLFLDFETLHGLEYVEANGLGGYASGTFSGAHSRKYHGLLVAALKPPVHRVVTVSKIDETVMVGDEAFSLACNQFPGALHPKGFQFITSFSRELFPEWTYQVKGITIRKTIAAVHGENTTLVIYEVIDAPEKFTLELRPFYASRDIHHLSKANDYIGQHYIFQKGIFQTMNYQGCPEFFISVPKSQFVEGRLWYHNFEFRQEQLRGMDYREDLFSHGSFHVSLRKGSRIGMIVSLDDPSGRDAVKLLREERKRREAIVKTFDYHPGIARLALAADQFIVKRDDMSSVIAGYPWFTDWGRDTMISLPGLCLVTGRIKEAKRIFQKYAEYISDGMIPNRFPDSGEDPEYNTIDATLWYFNALYLYYRYSNDKLLIKASLPILRNIIDWHYQGTRFGIHVDPGDELLSGGRADTQLTWMDAKIGDWPITPRFGKPVEVNALWYNALRIMEYFLTELNYHGDAEFFAIKASRVRESFNHKFSNKSNGSLFDCIGDGWRSEEIRPNQVYAVSLPFPVVDREKARGIMEVVEDHLLTPYGLRSLSPVHPEFRGRYEGNPHDRDSAYHQGPAWSHLIGAYVDALFFTFGEDARPAAHDLLENILQHLSEAGAGSVSEIFDGDPPYAPKGCIAQAWSVAEVLRVCVEHHMWGGRRRSANHSPLVEAAKLNRVQ